MAVHSKKISYYRNKADRALQNYITSTYKKCELCGKEVSCGHHFFPKSSSSALRYEELNIIPVCVGCHLGFHSNKSAEFIGRIISKRGNDWFQSLVDKKREIIKPTKKYYQDFIDFYGN